MRAQCSLKLLLDNVCIVVCICMPTCFHEVFARADGDLALLPLAESMWVQLFESWNIGKSLSVLVHRLLGCFSVDNLPGRQVHSLNCHF